MPRLHLLRPHRRTASAQPTSPNPSTTTLSPTAPSVSAPQPPRTAPPPLSTFELPPLDVHASNKTTVSAPATTLRVQASFSDLSPTPVPAVPKPTPVKTSLVTTVSSPTQSGNNVLAGGTFLPGSSKDSSSKRGTKRNLLNPMSLLMRRRASASNAIILDSSRARTTRDLPDDFDPGIIYGTRHPDWSSPPNRKDVTPPVNGRPMSPLPPPQMGSLTPILDTSKLMSVEVVADVTQEEPDKLLGSGFTEKFDDVGDGVLMDERALSRDSRTSAKSAGSPEVPRRPSSAAAAIPEAILEPCGQPPAHSFLNAISPVSPVSPVPSLGVEDTEPTAGDATARPQQPAASPLFLSASTSSASRSEGEGSLEPERRRGVTLVDHPLSLPHHLVNNSSRFSFENSSAAGSSSPDEFPREMDNNDEDDDDDDDNGDEEGLFNDFDEDGDDDGFERANRDYFGDADQFSGMGGGAGLDAGMGMNGGVGLGLGLGVREGVGEKELSLKDGTKIGNPRGLELEDQEFDFIQEDNGIAGYEDEDDDLYFDDGIILDNPQYHSPPEEVDSTRANIDSSIPTSENENESLHTELTLPTPEPTQFHSPPSAHPEDGSVESLPSNAAIAGGINPPTTFPPFMNPIGALYQTASNSQFYAPDGTLLDQTGNPLNLASITATLQRYQAQQLSSHLSGYESDPNDYPDFSGSQSFYSLDSYDEDPDDMVAAANADALACDTDGFYGQEFGFYAMNNNAFNELSYAGGYFGPPSEGMGELPRPIPRRPSLTPISERSECSYRNSLVIPSVVVGSLGSLGAGEGGGEGGEMMTLLRLRKNAWGGSNGSMRSGRSGGASPVVGSPLGVGDEVGLGISGGGMGAMGGPPGLAHPGSRGMVPTKERFDEGVVGGGDGGVGDW
ncbi:hypothetical protein RUND412_009327 [Rhizina undulata]